MVWWVALGYPSFEEGKDGFPCTGQVVKYYREKKRDDTGKAWTQSMLAKGLKVTEKAVGEIENLDTNIDVDRRQQLCQLLGIPSILLGIRTRAEIEREVEQKRAKQAVPVLLSSPESFWWEVCGYPPFAPGKDGFFPRTGEIVKHYRVQAMETKSKLWTQKGLAKALNLESDQTIWDMETRDTELNFERRQFLCRVLDIPPILFGIRSLDEIDKLLVQKGMVKAPVPIISTPTMTSHKLLIDVEEYAFLLNSYWTTFLRNPAQISMTNLDVCIDALCRELPHVREKKLIQELLCRFHLLVANILGDQQQEYNKALVHLEKAWRFAQLVSEDELKVAVLYDYGLTLWKAGYFNTAVQKYKQARRYEQRLPKNLWGSLLLHAGSKDAQVAETPEKKDAAIMLVDRVGNIVRSNRKEEDPYFLSLNVDTYHLIRSEALLAVGRNREAIEDLKLTEFGPDAPRRQAYKSFLEAQAQFNLGEYPEAARLAASGLVIALEIESEITITRVNRMYKQFPQDLFKYDPDVARLEYLLSKRKKRSKR